MVCNSVSRHGTDLAIHTTFVISATVFCIAAIALAIIFGAADPFSNQQLMHAVYADAILGGMAICGFAAGLICKYCKTSQNLSSSSRRAIEQPEAGSSFQTQNIIGKCDPVVNMENEVLVLDVQNLQKKILEDWEEISKISDDRPQKNIILHNGKHMTVFEHVQFPGLIIKLSSPASAQLMLNSVSKSQQILKEHPEIKQCKIPATRVVPLNAQYALFVMEKVKGIGSSYQALEVSEQAYEQFKNAPDMEDKWCAFFRDAAEYICLTGYWDVSWNNIILMENGFSFVDFEHIYPSEENILTGISKLLNIASPEFLDMIIGITSKHNVPSDILFERLMVQDARAFKLKRQSELDLRSRVRTWHKDHQITRPDDKINVGPWTNTQLEKTIVEKFNEEAEARQKHYAPNPIEQRKLWWRPLEQLGVQQEQFDAALKNLQLNGIVCDWTISEYPKIDPIYYIYF